MKTFKDYTGQTSAKKQLELEIAYCKPRNLPLRHILLYGMAGLGKTMLANIIGDVTGYQLVSTTGNCLKTTKDVVNFFRRCSATKEENSDPVIFFIDEIHLVEAQEAFYTAMTDNFIDLPSSCKLYDSVTGKKAERMWLSPFTVIGATTHSGLLLEAFRNRFNITIELIPYSHDELCQIVRLNSKNITDEATMMIAENSQARARRAKDLLISSERSKEHDIIQVTDVQRILDIENISLDGLFTSQVKALEALSTSNKNRMGLKSLCSTIGIDSTIFENELEKYLLYREYLIIGSGGRIITNKGLELLNEIRQRKG